MKSRRHEDFLATKANRRREDDVLKEIRESLEKLQTDHVDLIQVHTVNTWAHLEQTFAPDGTMAERDTLFEQVRPMVEKDGEENQKGRSDLFWLHDTVVTGWRHGSEPAHASY